MPPLIHWQKTWKREQTTCGPRRVLRSEEGYLLVDYYRPLGGEKRRVYALRDWRTGISHHRTLAAALRACERHARDERRDALARDRRKGESHRRQRKAVSR